MERRRASKITDKGEVSDNGTALLQVITAPTEGSAAGGNADLLWGSLYSLAYLRHPRTAGGSDRVACSAELRPVPPVS